MPSSAAYIALADARSDTGHSRILIPSVEEPVMVAPEVVGQIDPVCMVALRRTARREIDRPYPPAGLGPTDGLERPSDCPAARRSWRTSAGERSPDSSAASSSAAIRLDRPL